MKLISWMALAIGLMVGTSAFAAECISAADMTEIANKMPQFRDKAGKEFCYDGTQISNLLETIMFMRRTRWEVSMPKSADELFSGAFANDWWGYFTGRITEFSVESYCEKGVAAYVYGWGGRTMYVCPSMLTDNFTSLDRASIFMHEARHIDGYPHTTCRSGPRAGLQGACDTRIADGGSYAVTVETYAQLAEYAPDLHPALRAYARSSAVIYADETFQNPVQIQRDDHFLVMTGKKEFYKLNANGSTDIERTGDSPELGRIVLRAKHMILYPDDKTQPAKFVFAGNQGDIKQQAGDIAVEYNALPPAQRAELLEIHIGAQWSARFYRDRAHFLCNARSEESQDVSTGGQVPVAALYPTGYDRGANNALVIMESGAIFEFGCQGRGAFLRPSSATFDQPYKRIYRSGSEVLGLTKDGRLFRVTGSTSQPLQTAVDGQIFELVPVQSYSFFDKN